MVVVVVMMLHVGKSGLREAYKIEYYIPKPSSTQKWPESCLFFGYLYVFLYSASSIISISLPITLPITYVWCYSPRLQIALIL